MLYIIYFARTSLEVIAISFVVLSRRLRAIRSDGVVSIDRNSELFTFSVS